MSHYKKPSSLQSESSESAPLSVDFALSGYSLVKRLGHGSQGNVFLARRQSDGTEIAVKRLNIESVKTWKSYELFHREAEVLKSLHIDGIARFYDAFDRLDDDPPCAYIIQEYIPGETLASYIKAGHRFPIDRVYDIMIQLLKILRQLHAHTPPIIHRDIKPSNIILQQIAGDNYKVYLIDFGAVSNPQLQGGGSTVAGTYGFMPPEQLMGKPVTQSDIYALAAVAVNLITGKSPADMPVKDFHLIFEPEMQFMPVAVVDVLRRMLEPNVENRLSDFNDLIQTFEQFRLGNYDISNSNSNLISISDYENQLKNVTSYAQTGNIELWQRLPSEKYLPNCYLKALQPKDITDTLLFGTNSHIYQKRYKTKKTLMDEKLKVHPKGDNRFGWGDLLYLLMGLGICGLILIWYSIGFHKESSTAFAMFFGFMSALILPLFILFLIKHFISKRTAMHFKFDTPKENMKIRQHFFNTLGNGRKTIATIVSIDYLNVLDDLCEKNVKTMQFAVHQPPTFNVKYRFNPPDDSNPNDLVHEIIVHEDPETFLKVGDPLPILYLIDRHFTDEHVYSIPFPLVLSDIEQLKDVLGYSKRVCFYRNY